MRVTFFICFSLFYLLLLDGQTNTLKGYIQKKGNPVDFPLANAYISLDKNNAETFSNLSGYFNLNFSDDTDTLRVSLIGYKLVKVPINSIQYMDSPVLIYLDEVESKKMPLSQNAKEKGKRIVVQASKKRRKNYTSNASLLSGVYRHQVYQDNLYSFLSQAKMVLAPTIQWIYPPIQKPEDAESYVQAYLLDAELSMDARDFRLSFKVSLMELLATGVFQNDAMLDFPEMFNFYYMREVEWENNKIHEIRYQVKKKFDTVINIEGMLYVDPKNFGIVKKIMHRKLNPQIIEGKNPFFFPFKAQFNNLDYQVTTHYRHINGYWQPKYIQRLWKIAVVSEKFPALNHRYMMIDDFFVEKYKNKVNLVKESDRLNKYLRINLQEDLKAQMDSLSNKKYSYQKDFNTVIAPDFEMDNYNFFGKY